MCMQLTGIEYLDGPDILEQAVEISCSNADALEALGVIFFHAGNGGRSRDGLNQHVGSWVLLAGASRAMGNALLMHLLESRDAQVQVMPGAEFIENPVGCKA